MPRFPGALLSAFARCLRPSFIFSAFAIVVGGCASLPGSVGPARPETVVALTASGRLLTFNAGQPQKIRDQRALTGLPPGERLVAIDYRVHRGVLYGLGTSSRLYTIDVPSGRATAVGGTAFAIPVTGEAHGFDFNPTVDRIRWVAPSGQNARLHPDTGAVVDGDPATAGLQLDGPLAYAAGDPNAGRVPSVAAAAYTYNKRDEKLTTNYVIDGALGILAVQGSLEGATPAVSPNTGRLITVGSLGLGALHGVSFDIADLDNAAFVAAATAPGGPSRLYGIDLGSGRARLIGTIAGGERIVGIAIEP